MAQDDRPTDDPGAPPTPDGAGKEEGLDEDWFPPLTAEGADPQLASLSPPINWFRPVLMVAVIAFAVYLGTQFTTEIRYFFSDDAPVDIGDVTEFPERTSEGDRPVIPENRLVKVAGIPTRMSISCSPSMRYFKLVGAHVYVELPMDEDMSAIACKAEREKSSPEISKMQFYEGTGRAVSLGGTGKRYGNLKAFYERNYGELFCSSMTESRKEARLTMLRQMLRETNKTKEGKYPSDEEVERLLAGETLCHDAWLIQATTTPGVYWPYLLIYVVLALIILWNLFTLARWVRRNLMAP